MGITNHTSKLVLEDGIQEFNNRTPQITLNFLDLLDLKCFSHHIIGQSTSIDLAWTNNSHKPLLYK